MERADLVEGELHRTAGVTGLVHDEHATTDDRGGRTGHDDRSRSCLAPRHGHGAELALENRRDHHAGNHAGLGDAEDDFRLIFAGHVHREGAAELTEKRPIDLEHSPGP